MTATLMDMFDASTTTFVCDMHMRLAATDTNSAVQYSLVQSIMDTLLRIGKNRLLIL